MKLNSIKPVIGSTKNRKRVGRGNATGVGTFCGRGCKGQGQRKSGNVRRGFEGGQTSLIMRLPKLRGFNNPNRVPYQVINVSDLNCDCLKEGVVITKELLLEKKMISKKDLPVKILGMGKLTKKVTVNVDKISTTAKEKILAAGGKIQ